MQQTKRFHMLLDIRKAKALKENKMLSLKWFDDLEDVILEGKKFAVKCYGCTAIFSSKNRCTICVNRT